MRLHDGGVNENVRCGLQVLRVEALPELTSDTSGFIAQEAIVDSVPVANRSGT